MKSKNKKRYLIRNLIYVTITLIILAIPVANVYTKSILSESNIKLEELKNSIKEQEGLNESLKAEIDVLASYDQMQEIAEANGLTYNNDNIKVVKNK